jgi:hypothetical protein
MKSRSIKSPLRRVSRRIPVMSANFSVVGTSDAGIDALLRQAEPQPV